MRNTLTSKYTGIIAADIYDKMLWSFVTWAYQEDKLDRMAGQSSML